jgi:hypothetical protein
MGTLPYAHYTKFVAKLGSTCQCTSEVAKDFRIDALSAFERALTSVTPSPLLDTLVGILCNGLQAPSNIKDDGIMRAITNQQEVGCGSFARGHFSIREAIEMQLHREAVHAAIRKHRISNFFQPIAKCKLIPMKECDDPSLFAPVFPSQPALTPQKPRRCLLAFCLKSMSRRPVRRQSCLGTKCQLPRQPKLK